MDILVKGAIHIQKFFEKTASCEEAATDIHYEPLTQSKMWFGEIELIQYKVSTYVLQ